MLNPFISLPYSGERNWVNSSADTYAVKCMRLRGFTAKENSIQRQLNDLPEDTKLVISGGDTNLDSSLAQPTLSTVSFLQACWQRFVIQQSALSLQLIFLSL